VNRHSDERNSGFQTINSNNKGCNLVNLVAYWSLNVIFIFFSIVPLPLFSKHLLKTIASAYIC